MSIMGVSFGCQSAIIFRKWKQFFLYRLAIVVHVVELWVVGCTWGKLWACEAKHRWMTTSSMNQEINFSNINGILSCNVDDLPVFWSFTTFLLTVGVLLDCDAWKVAERGFLLNLRAYVGIIHSSVALDISLKCNEVSSSFRRLFLKSITVPYACKKSRPSIASWQGPCTTWKQLG